MEMVLALITIPALAALLMLATPWVRLQYLLASLMLVALSAISLWFYGVAGTMHLELSHGSWIAVIAADVALLLYFAQQGWRFKDRKVLLLALSQLLLYGVAEALLPDTRAAAIVIGELSRFMFLVINIVGGIIVLYAIRYMSYEAVSELRKRLFVAYLMLFLSVMNAIVVADSLLLFFFLFEMTTLASYLLIAFRDDEQSRANALRALWMNQIGGVAILLGTLVAVTGFEAVSFEGLLAAQGHYVLLAVALVSIAALVKGASVPFDSWLLGAMVAPTPVSAMLHSAAMVKIAPYLILKLAPALETNIVGVMLSIIGALVFVAASYLALSRSVFKEILGYSTIALLGLMMSLAAVATEESMLLAQVLLLFHALSKALLFLTAGVLEKEHHVKDIEAMKGVVHRAPKSVGYIMFGFISLTLPPFGLFMGKLFAIASVASLLHERPWLIVVLLGIIVGSTLLVLLYFKVASALLARPSDVVRSETESLPAGFNIPLQMLGLLTLLAAVGFITIQNDGFLTLFALPLALVVALPWMVRFLERYDRAATYHCGEKELFDAALFYIEPSERIRQMIYWGFGTLLCAVVLGGALS